MAEGDVYTATEQYAMDGSIAYVHVRNVIGKVPEYHEVFIDEGDIDVRRIMNILQRAEFDGVLIPDHTPLMSCDSGWYAGMAYTMGYMRGLIQGME